jgi:hypothetical protein
MIWKRLTKMREIRERSFRPSTGSIVEEAVSRNILDTIRNKFISTINMDKPNAF